MGTFKCMEVSLKTMDYKHCIVRRQIWKHLLFVSNDTDFNAGKGFLPLSLYTLRAGKSRFIPHTGGGSSA